MNTLLFSAASALWLGILTSISPCPLATNIAAISFISRRLTSTRKIILSGLFYTMGRMLAYLALAIILLAGLLSTPALSYFLQKYMNSLLGPLLILAGMFLLELLQIGSFTIRPSAQLQQKIEQGGLWPSGLLGFIFALAFCPVSAGLFFLCLVPLAVKNNSPLVLPILYGIGTALPVLVFAFLIALGAHSLALAYNKLTIFERWARRVTGVVFILVGIYYCLTYIFNISFSLF